MFQLQAVDTQAVEALNNKYVKIWQCIESRYINNGIGGLILRRPDYNITEFRQITGDLQCTM
jgi:hypothetical protein